MRGALLILALVALFAGCGGSKPVLDLVAADSASVAIDSTRVESAADDAAQGTRRNVHELWSRAHALAQHDSLEAAGREIQGALALDSLDAASLALFSEVEYRAGRHDEAIARLTRARRALAPCPLELTASLALHLASKGETSRADSLLAPFYAEDDAWTRIGSVLAFAALRSDHPERLGPRAAERALEADPSPINLNNRGIALLIQGDAREARRVLEQAHERAPDLPGPLYNLAIVERFYFRNDAKAREWFEHYLNLSSDDPDGLKSVLAPDRAGGEQ